jgi:hypothetical protein
MRDSTRQAPPSTPFETERFTMQVHPGWADETVYVLEGPGEDEEIAPSITINIDAEAGDIALIDYADRQLTMQQETLQACRLLMKQFTALDTGETAYRAVLSWTPTDERRLFREQWFVVDAPVAYTLTATLTKRMRRTIGPRVRAALRSFVPGRPLSLRT